MTATVDRNGAAEAKEPVVAAAVADDGQMGAAEDELARELAGQARAEGLRLTGPGGPGDVGYVSV